MTVRFSKIGEHHQTYNFAVNNATFKCKMSQIINNHKKNISNRVFTNNLGFMTVANIFFLVNNLAHFAFKRGIVGCKVLFLIMLSGFGERHIK